MDNIFKFLKFSFLIFYIKVQYFVNTICVFSDECKHKVKNSEDPRVLRNI